MMACFPTSDLIFKNTYILACFLKSVFNKKVFLIEILLFILLKTNSLKLSKPIIKSFGSYRILCYFLVVTSQSRVPTWLISYKFGILRVCPLYCNFVKNPLMFRAKIALLLSKNNDFSLQTSKNTYLGISKFDHITAILMINIHKIIAIFDLSAFVYQQSDSFIALKKPIYLQSGIVHYHLGTQIGITNKMLYWWYSFALKPSIKRSMFLDCFSVVNKYWI